MKDFWKDNWFIFILLVLFVIFDSMYLFDCDDSARNETGHSQTTEEVP